MHAIADGHAPEITDILAAVTPGGGKSLLPVIAAHALLAARLVERVCWVVPRDSLRQQAEEAFADPAWRRTLGHAVSVRAADNAPDPARGLQGYVTTYQSVAASPDLHLAEFRRHRTLLVLDEVHHLPALSDMAPDPLADPATPDLAAGWSRALLPLLETARLRLLLSGTLQRADGRSILWLPYRTGPRMKTREVDLAAPGWAVVGYSRAQALAERAVLPVLFGAVDGEASWLDEARTPTGPHRLASPWPTETTRPALFTALRTGFADGLLREAFTAARTLRAERRRLRGHWPPVKTPGVWASCWWSPPTRSAPAATPILLRGWMPPAQAATVQLATSDERDAHETLARFRLTAEPSVLVTVAMAYEGLDAPRSCRGGSTDAYPRPRLAGADDCTRHPRRSAWLALTPSQRALVFHPDDPLFARFRHSVETEQGTLAKHKQTRARSKLPNWLLDQLAGHEREDGIVSLESNALGLRYGLLRPGPDYVLHRPEQDAAQTEMLDAPSVLERRLRQRIGEMVAQQAVEDEGAAQAPHGEGLYHRYNAILKRCTGDKPRAQMSLSELEAAVSWLERNRLSDHAAVLKDDPRYGWTLRQRRDWTPPVGRSDGKPRGALRPPVRPLRDRQQQDDPVG